MTTKEKARAYDEAIERARRIKNGEDDWRYSDLTEIIPALEEVLPELAESDDERILASIADCVSLMGEDGDVFSNHNVTKVCVLSWIEKQKNKKSATIEQVYEKFLSSDTLKSVKENKYIRAQLFWELMHNGIITEVDYLYLTDVNRKPWTEEEYLKAYKKGFETSEQLKRLGM